MKFNTNNYTVEMDLRGAEFRLNRKQISVFEERLNKIGSYDADFWDICSFRDGILRYESETLLPAKMDGSKQRRVLLVLGNPAIHSVKNGMFFYSKVGGSKHQFWGKLAKAGVVKALPKTTREEEANSRRDMILNGTNSEKYLVGLTTFYSFPTPGSKFSFAGVAGVERLFKPIIQQVCKMETERILSYPFTDGTIVVFCQTSSFQRFTGITDIKPIFWPLLFKGAGGENLAKLLKSASPVQLNDPL